MNEEKYGDDHWMLKVNSSVQEASCTWWNKVVMNPLHSFEVFNPITSSCHIYQPVSQHLLFSQSTFIKKNIDIAPPIFTFYKIGFQMKTMFSHQKQKACKSCKHRNFKA